MAEHRFWRLVGFAVAGNGPLELSEARLYASGALADESATLACTFTPASGALADLHDGVATGVVSWPHSAHNCPGFALVWDLGAPSTVDALQLGSSSAADAFPLGLVIQSSDDGLDWTTRDNPVGIKYPGAHSLTSGSVGVGQTWIPLVNAANMTLSGGDLTATRSNTGGYQAVRSNYPVTGKKYWEIEVLAGGAYVPPYMISGVQTLSASLDGGVGVGTGGWGYHSKDGDLYLKGWKAVLHLPICGAGDTIMFACDAATGYLWFGKNGVWFLGGNPSAGTGWQASTTGVVYPAASLYATGSKLAARFSGDFVYAPPNGFMGFDGAPYISLDTAFPPSFQTAGMAQQMAGALRPDGAVSSHLRERQFFDVYHGGRGIIRSTVKQKDTPVNTPLRRRVDLIDERSRLTIRETWSDAAGNYEFRGIREDLVYSVVAWDHLHNYRAEIADNITLANGGVELLP